MPAKENKATPLTPSDAALYRCPTSETSLVCPHCLIPVGSYAFITKDDVRIETCTTHGAVVPRRSAVANIPAYGPRTGTHPLATYTPDRNAEIRRFAARLLVQPIISRRMETYA